MLDVSLMSRKARQKVQFFKHEVSDTGQGIDVLLFQIQNLREV